MSHLPAIVASHVKEPDVAVTPKAAVPAPKRDQVVKQVRMRPNRSREPGKIVGSQLPTARPLSSEEKLLLAFARNNPKEVVSTIAWQEQMRRPPEPVSESDRGEQQ